MRRNLKIERVYPFPPEVLWQALTEREALAQWLMENDFIAEVGHKFQFRTRPAPGFDGIVNCEVLVVEPLRRLSYSWASGKNRTVVTWELEAVAEGTRLRLHHEGFDGLNGLLVSFILEAGWKRMFKGSFLQLLQKEQVIRACDH
ncbi:MAG TPA: SRPBCC domain-containing protein [Chloroflexia bacterium]|nr:SRPBCC domain-containing protein [Chloroflexia bacterium]